MPLSYKAPLRDIRFLTNEVFNYPEHYKTLKSGENYKYNKDWTRYIDKNGIILFADNLDQDDKNKAILYVDYNKVWKFLSDFGLNDMEINDICIAWLYETHKRKVDTAQGIMRETCEALYETHK